MQWSQCHREDVAKAGFDRCERQIYRAHPVIVARQTVPPLPSAAIASLMTSLLSACVDICASDCHTLTSRTSWPNAAFMSIRRPFTTGCTTSRRSIRKWPDRIANVSVAGGVSKRPTLGWGAAGVTLSEQSTRMVKSSTSLSVRCGILQLPRCF